MDEPNVETTEATPLYNPSWIDRFYDWVGMLPGPVWIYYVGCAVFLILVQLVFLSFENGLERRELFPILIYNGVIIPSMLALFKFLDSQARSGLKSMMSVLDMTDTKYHVYDFKLANMPSLPAHAAGFLLLLFVIGMEQVSTLPIRYGALEQLPIFNVIFQLIDKSSAFLYGVFFYHTIRQLRLVNTIHAKHAKVNLLNLRPLRSFSRLTASTAVGLVIGVYGWMLINPDLLSDPVNLLFIVMITGMAFITFAWPLYGVHQRMVLAKESALHEFDQGFDEVFSKFNTALRDDDYAAIEKLNGIIASLETQYRKIEGISTWPWRSDTIRPVITAIAAPVILTIIQFIIDKGLSR